MTIKEFVKVVPLSSETRVLLSGDTVFDGKALNSDGRFTVYYLQQLMTKLNSIESDPNILNISVYNNMLWIDLCE